MAVIKCIPRAIQKGRLVVAYSRRSLGSVVGKAWVRGLGDGWQVAAVSEVGKRRGDVCAPLSLLIVSAGAMHQTVLPVVRVVFQPQYTQRRNSLRDVWRFAS